MARPSIYTPELAATICERLAEKESLRSICRDPAMPCFSTVMRWVGDTKHPEFSEQYARGRECGLEAMADELLEIADQTLPRLRDGRIDGGKVNQLRLQIDARKWVMSKQFARKYGDKVDLNHGGNLSLTVVTGVPHSEPDDE